MDNRRNFYRILHVQPEAPHEVIKASYRSLMTKLKVHPDLGGDHATAVLVNQAYVVLSDPQKRKQYDNLVHSRNSQARTHSANKAPFETPKPTTSRSHGSYRSGRDESRPESATAQNRCLFCGTLLVQSPKANKQCSNCSSPLTPSQPITNQRLREIFGRRAVPRIKKVGVLIIFPRWPHAGFSARLCDLSPSGISMHTAYGARVGQILKFDSSHLKGIAHVVSVRANGAHFLVHAAFLTAEFMTKTGVFVTEKV
ncbi:MAG: J domain-containing protein [Methylobacter sp.]|nr:J domain-containing protein [Methylobacter sp.]